MRYDSGEVLRCTICTGVMYAGGICPRCSLGGMVALTDRDREIIDQALGAFSSDYNDAPHEEIDALRKLLAGTEGK